MPPLARLLVTLLGLALASCTSVKPITTPDGRQGYAVAWYLPGEYVLFEDADCGPNEQGGGVSPASYRHSRSARNPGLPVMLIELSC